MAGRDRELARTVGKVKALRDRVEEARHARRSVRIFNAFEYDILKQALELLGLTIKASNPSIEYEE